MALKVLLTEDPAEELILRIDETFHLDPDRASLQRVRRALAGNDPTFLAARALEILFASDFPNKHRDFERILADESVPAHTRSLAAAYLGRLQTPEAVDILIEHLDIRDESVLAAILRALAVAGDRRALDAIVELVPKLRTSAVQDANVAEALIAYRAGVEGADLPLTSGLRFLDVEPSSAGKLEISVADRNDVEFCLRSLGRRPYGIELAESPAFQVRCQERLWIVLLNRECSTPSGIASGRQRAMLGVVALRERETGLYSPAYVLLTTSLSQEGNIRILACRSNGRVIFGGEAHADDDRVHFSLRAVARPGAFALAVDATFEDGQLRVDRALTSLRAQVEPLRPIAERAQAR
jgi:hypothetical protein